MTDQQPTTRIRLRTIEPGDRLVRIEQLNLTGPRGGRYVHRGMSPRGGRPMEFTHHQLSRDGRERTFHFVDAHPFTVADSLSCKLVAHVIRPGSS